MAHEPGRRRLFPALAALACFVLAASASSQSRLPGPLVYVVTPATRRLQIDSAPRGAPYYYSSWRRGDTASSSTTTTTTPRPPPETPDLIFAEFESDGGRDEDAARKSIRNLLQRERVKATAPTSTASTSDLIFAEFESGKDREKSIKNLLSKERINENTASKIMPLPPFSNMYAGESSDHVHAAYNKIYEEVSQPTAPPTAPIPEPSTEQAEEPTLAPMKVEDIWHVIDKEKVHEEEGGWQEVPVEQFTAPTPPYASTLDDNEAGPTEPTTTEDPYDGNFVFPGFHSNEDKATDNESRAIRTESNLRFPYVNLKTYQMKNKPLLSNGKKGNHMYTSVDHFRDVNHPLRGEAQDSGPPPPPPPPPPRAPQQVDRYNPAQPYLPPSPYGNVNKQAASPAAPARPPTKTVANLIPPPPPPPPPQPAPGDFPSPPDTYESFPPYAPAPPPPKPPSKPAPAFRPTLPPPQASDDSDAGSPMSDDDSGPPGYSYSPPGAGGGYSYKRPSSGGGYSYKPPSSGNGGYSYKPPPAPPLAPPPEDDTGPPSDDSNPPPDDSAPPDDDKPSFTGYSYGKPHGPSLSHDAHDDSDYPELIFSKPHGVQMMPPPPPPPPAGGDGGMGMDDAKPDFPNLMFPPHDGGGGYKHHHHDFEDFEPYHHHHHHHTTTTTTTTTTEMPRVNRFSYYYLGKKLYYLPLYFSVYFVVYVAALIIKAVLRHKIVYPNSWQPYSGAAGVSRRGERALPADRLHELTRLVTNALMRAAEKYTADQQQR